MSEYEAYDLILNLASSMSQLLFGYFSVISAFLIMSYFIAGKLNTIHSSIILFLFTVCASYITINLYLLNVDLDNLYVDMLQKKASGIYELLWFGKNPAWVTRLLSFVLVLIGVGGYLCSLLFFFSQKKRQLEIN